MLTITCYGQTLFSRVWLVMIDWRRNVDWVVFVVVDWRGRRRMMFVVDRRRRWRMMFVVDWSVVVRLVVLRLV